MSFFEELATRALNDNYLKNLIYKVETMYGQSTFKYDEIDYLTKKEYYHVMRFADILSRSQNADARNKALEIISLLYEIDKYQNDNDFYKFSLNVLTKLGNFPSLSIIKGSKEVTDEEIVIDEILKGTIQKAPKSNHIFTDAQFKVFEKIKESNHYSFSGSTSFGKSFIIETFINYIIEERNGNDNIVILVPTRALINQVSLKLKTAVKNDKYRIITHPKVPSIYKNKGKKFILVLTAERLLSYFSDLNNPALNYLFVDEAHKLLNDKDQRTPLLYHALTQAKRKSLKIYFASPNVPNTEVFLQLIGNSTEESISITESPVSQNRFYIDCIEMRATMFSEYGNEISFNNLKYMDNPLDNLYTVINKLGSEKQNIIYCNTTNYTVDFARSFASKLQIKSSEKLKELIKLVEENLHNKYYLIDCLKKGVAFHYGNMPQRIRERIESLFRSGEIQYLFCTSTLLEGVNLPAKNIFILSNKIGMTNMNQLNFWNLAGRAGRLTKDLSGNIFCVRIFNKEGYWNDIEQINLLKKKKITEVEVPLMKKYDKNLYKNIKQSIIGERFTNKRLSDNEKKSIMTYGNILLYHKMVENDSILRNQFLKKNNDGIAILNKVMKELEIPEHILAQSTDIPVCLQNSVYIKPSIEVLPDTTDYTSCLKLLNILYDCYSWGENESGGHKPLIRNRSHLNYYAILINSWVNSKPLNVIIQETIKYYTVNSKDLVRNGYQRVKFNEEDVAHINLLINNVIYDIENSIRFKIKNYVNNYLLLLEERGYKNISNWSDYLEFGTTDRFIIEIQNLGFSRHIANFLKIHHADCFELVNEEIIEFNQKKLKTTIDKVKYKDEYLELAEVLDWTQSDVTI